MTNSDLAALPIYIIVYSVRKALQVREESGEYCYFHGENHMVTGYWDDHQCQSLECPDKVCVEQEHGHFTKFDSLESDACMRSSLRKKGYTSILNALDSKVYP